MSLSGEHHGRWRRGAAPALLRRHELGLLLSRGTRWRLLVAFLGALVVAGTEIVALASVVPLMDLLTGGTAGGASAGVLRRLGVDPQDAPTVLACVIFGAYLIKGLFGLGYRWWVSGFLADQQVETASRLLRYFLKVDYELHLRRSLADFTRRLFDAVIQTYNGVIMNGISIMSEAVSIIAILAILLVLQPLPALGMIIYFGLVASVLYLGSRARALEAGKRQLEAATEIWNMGIEPLRNVKDIMLRGNEEQFVSRYRSARAKGAQAGRVASFLIEVPKYTLEIVFILGVAVLTIATFARESSQGAVVTLSLFAISGFRILPSLSRMMAAASSLRVNTAGLHMILDEISAVAAAESEEVGHSGGAGELPRVQRVTNSIKLENIWFSYHEGGEPVLRGISLDVPAGLRVGIVGASGAGKSTLADLLLGFHRPTDGEVLVDGVSIDARSIGWRRNIGMVPQDVSVLDGDFVDNISFRDPEPDLQRVKSAARLARLEEFIESLPAQYSTVLGQGEMGLSGGQRQRLGMARAFYREVGVLVLDEATSALDNSTESEVSAALRELPAGTTLITIAHRLSTIKGCDVIVLMDGGRVLAQGGFEALYQKSAEFRRLVDLGGLSTNGAGELKSNRSSEGR